MGQEAIYFGENGIIKSAFHKNKTNNINEVDNEKRTLDIEYKHESNAFPSPLCVKLPQMNVHAKYFDKNRKYINHWVKYEKILKKYLKIWKKIKSLAKKESNSEPVYKDKHIKSKFKIYNGRVHANFQHNKIPKDNENCACSLVVYFC